MEYLVVFEKRIARLELSGSSCAKWGRGFHTMAREPKRVFLRSHAPKLQQNSNRRGKHITVWPVKGGPAKGGPNGSKKGRNEQHAHLEISPPSLKPDPHPENPATHRNKAHTHNATQCKTPNTQHTTQDRSYTPINTGPTWIGLSRPKLDWRKSANHRPKSAILSLARPVNPGFLVPGPLQWRRRRRREGERWKGPPRLRTIEPENRQNCLLPPLPPSCLPDPFSQYPYSLPLLPLTTTLPHTPEPTTLLTTLLLLLGCRKSLVNSFFFLASLPKIHLVSINTFYTLWIPAIRQPPNPQNPLNPQVPQDPLNILTVVFTRRPRELQTCIGRRLLNPLNPIEPSLKLPWPPLP